MYVCSSPSPSSLLSRLPLQLRRREASDALAAASAMRGEEAWHRLCRPPASLLCPVEVQALNGCGFLPGEHGFLCFLQTGCLFISRFTGELERQKVGIVCLRRGGLILRERRSPKYFFPVKPEWFFCSQIRINLWERT